MGDGSVSGWKKSALRQLLITEAETLSTSGLVIAVDMIRCSNVARIVVNFYGRVYCQLFAFRWVKQNFSRLEKVELPYRVAILVSVVG